MNGLGLMENGGLNRGECALPASLQTRRSLLILMVVVAVVAGTLPASAQARDAMDADACLDELTETSLGDMGGGEILEGLHESLRCPITENQRGLEAALWTSIGQLSVGESNTTNLQEARANLWLTADLDHFRAEIGSSPQRNAAIGYLTEIDDRIGAMESRSAAYAAPLSAPTVQTGVSVLQEEFALRIGSWFTKAGNDGTWLDGNPLSEGQRIESYQVASQAYKIAGQYALAASMEALWVQAEAPYQADLKEVERVVDDIDEHLALWEQGSFGIFQLKTVFWYGKAVQLESELAWADGVLEGYREPEAADTKVLQTEFVQLKSLAGLMVAQLFLIVLLVGSMLTAIVLYAQNRWVNDFQEATLGAELLWKGER